MEGVNLHFHAVGTPKAAKTKNPRRFSRLVDLRPVEQSRGPSLVKVNTSSRQSMIVRAPSSPPPPSFSTLVVPRSSSSFFCRLRDTPFDFPCPFLSVTSSPLASRKRDADHPPPQEPLLLAHAFSPASSCKISIRLTNASPRLAYGFLKSVLDARSFPTCCRYPSSCPRNQNRRAPTPNLGINITISRRQRVRCCRVEILVIKCPEESSTKQLHSRCFKDLINCQGSTLADKRKGYWR